MNLKNETTVKVQFRRLSKASPTLPGVGMAINVEGQMDQRQIEQLFCDLWSDLGDDWLRDILEKHDYDLTKPPIKDLP